MAKYAPAAAICEDCHATFAANSSSARYCPSCSYPLVTCPACGQQFRVQRRRMTRCALVTCSRACYAQARTGKPRHSLQGQNPVRPALVVPAEPPVPVSPWLTYDEASQQLGLTVGEVHSLVAAGMLQTFTDRTDRHTRRTLLWRDLVEQERTRRTGQRREVAT